MKKFKTFACTMVMAIIMVVSASAVDFVDVDSDAWYYGAVTTLTERGIVSGTGEGQFSPERSVTAAEFATMLARSNGSIDAFSITATWDEAAMAYAVEQGWIDNQMEGNHTLSREEAAAMLMNSIGAATNDEKDCDTPFLDNNLISVEYRSLVACAVEMNIISATSANRTFRPQENISRAEACRLIVRAYDFTA